MVSLETRIQVALLGRTRTLQSLKVLHRGEWEQGPSRTAMSFPEVSEVGGKRHWSWITTGKTPTLISIVKGKEKIISG